MTRKFALENSNPPGFIQSVMIWLRNIIVGYKGTVGSPLSVADISKIARIEPVTILSSDLTGVKELYYIMHGVLNIYTAYYLQAISILSAQLHDVRILKILDKTNPDRDLKTLLTASYTAYESLSLKNTRYKLPMTSTKTIAVEAGLFEEEDEDTLSTSIHKLDTFEKLGPAVGKVVEVRFTVKSESTEEPANLTIPVVVKLDTMIVNNEVVNNILSTHGDEITFTSRIQDAFSGRINFIKDFLLASDLIRNHKKTLLKDNTNTYNTILKRINNSRIYSVLSGNISLAGVSSIIVITEQNETEITKKLGGKLSSTKIRKLIFDNTMAMMIVVIDREWERVSIYVRDIDGYSQNSFDSFKTLNDKNNNQIADIFKAFSLGNAPSF